jgi:NitT/TauT family transport system permease protein
MSTVEQMPGQPAPAQPSPAVAGRRAHAGGVLRIARRVAAVILYIGCLVALWWAVVEVFDVSPLVIPGPEGVWNAMTDHASLLLENTLYTLEEALLGFAVATIVGVALAVVIVSSPAVSRVLLPTLVAVNSAPKVVVAPILIIWLGLGMLSKVGMAFLLAFFPIVIATVQGLSDVEPNLVNLYRLMRSSRVTILRRVRLPNAVPHLISGMKIALPLAIIGAVIGEFVAARRGIGHEIVLAYSNFDTELVFAAVIVITLASVLLFEALSWTERRVLRWRPTSFDAR